MKNKIIASGIFFLLFGNLIFAQNKTTCRITNKFAVEGNGGWDLLAKEEGTDRLFISHGTMVQVLDVKTGKVVGTINDTKGVHGIALAADVNKGFTSNGKDTSVTVFDLKTLSTVASIKSTGINPDVIMYDAFTHRVFCFNARSNNATVIDAKTNAVLETIAFAGNPELAVSDGNGKIYVNLEDTSMVAVINAVTMKVEKAWSVAPGEEPSGIALDNKTHRVFSVCGNKLMIVTDAQTGKVIAQLPIGDRVDGAAFDPLTKRAFSSNGDGTITVVQEINANKFEVLENFKTQKGARTVAIDTKTHKLYLPVAEYGEKPEPTSENPKPRAKIKEGTFAVLEVEILP
jgi:YVTN family beta-propeller protein